MRSLDGSDAADEAEVLLLLLAELVKRQVDAVVDRLNVRHGLALTLKVTDGYEVNVGIGVVKLAKALKMRMVNGVNEWSFNETRVRQAGSIVQMNDVTRFGSVSNSPGRVIDVFQVVVNFSLDRPLCFSIQRTFFDRHRRFAVTVNHDFG